MRGDACAALTLRAARMRGDASTTEPKVLLSPLFLPSLPPLSLPHLFFYSLFYKYLLFFSVYCYLQNKL